jgi:hypothetical protein
MALDSGGERYLYHAMSLFFPFARCSGYQCFRFAAPLLASFVPLQTTDAFIVVGVVCEVLAGTLMWYLAKHFQLSDRAAAYAVLWYWATWGPIGALHEALLVPDPFQILWNLSALLLLLKRRYALALPVLVIGAAAKETPIAVPFIYTAYTVLAGERRPPLRWIVLLIVAPIAMWIGSRRLLVALFQYSATADVAYVLKFYTLNLWLDQLGPWPKNVAIAGLYAFAGFGAAWLLGMVELVRCRDRRLRAIALAAAPAMIGLALMQEPHRALNAFPFAMLLPAAAYSATVPTAAIAAALTANAAFTLRMAGKVNWLPPVPLLLLLVIAAAIWCLRAPRQTDSPDTSPEPVGARLVPAAVVMMSVVLLATAAVRIAATASTRRITIAAPAQSVIVDDDRGTPGIAVAPDSSRIAFVASDGAGRQRLWIRDLPDGASHELAGTDGASAPFWSPDSAQIGFFADDRLEAIHLASGAVRTLAVAPDAHGGTWAGDVIVFASLPGGGLHRIASAGGNVADAAVVDSDDPAASYRWPSFLPDGRQFLFVERNSTPIPERVRLGSLVSTGSRRVLESEAHSLTYVAPGVEVYGRFDAVRLQAFDTRRLSFAPLEIVLTSAVAESKGFSRAAVSASDRVLAYAPQTTAAATRSSGDGHALFWYDCEGHRGPASVRDRDALVDVRATPIRATLQSPAAKHAQLSPDGKWIAYAGHDREFYEVFVEPVPATGRRWLVSTDGGDQPRWRSDGRELFYVSENRFVMSAAIATSPDFHADHPRRVLDVPMPLAPPGQFQFAPAPDGQRFLINTITDRPRSAVIDVLFNWRSNVARLDVR